MTAANPPPLSLAWFEDSLELAPCAAEPRNGRFGAPADARTRSSISPPRVNGRRKGFRGLLAPLLGFLAGRRIPPRRPHVSNAVSHEGQAEEGEGKAD